MGLQRTVTNVTAGDDIVESWGDAVYTDIGEIINHGKVNQTTDAPTVTFNMDVSKIHSVTMAGNRTIAVTNDDTNQLFIIILRQDAVGGRLVTWFPGIQWNFGGTTPVLTTTPNKYDTFAFIKIAAGSYLGYVIGQNA